MSSYLIYNHSSGEAVSTGHSLGEAMENVVINDGEFLDDLEARQISVYKEMSGDLQLLGLEFVSHIPREKKK